MYSRGLGLAFSRFEQMEGGNGQSCSQSNHPWGEMREPGLRQHYANNTEQ